MSPTGPIQPTGRFSLHKIQGDSPLSFNPHHYSRFKFGDERYARRLGHDLADAFAQTHLPDIPSTGVAVAVCYEAVPTAAYYLRKHFMLRLNEHLLQAAKKFPPCQEAHIKREANFYEDFGQMSALQRAASLDRDTFSLATAVPPEKMMIYLDDVRITGTHERKMLSVLKQYQLQQQQQQQKRVVVNEAIWVVYFAELVDSSLDPTLENLLNYYAFSSLDEIAKLPRTGHFVLNARFTKHLLSQDGRNFAAFLDSQDRDFRRRLYHAARADRWDQMPKFQKNLALLVGRLGCDYEEEEEEEEAVEVQSTPVAMLA